MWNLKVLTLILIIPAAVFAQSPFTICEPFSPSPFAIRVPNCNNQYCFLQRGQFVHYQAMFRPPVTSRHLFTYVHVLINRVWFSLNIGANVHGCTNIIQGQCPLFAGQTAIMSSNLVFPRNVAPGQLVAVQINTINEFQQTVFCFRINGFIAG